MLDSQNPLVKPWRLLLMRLAILLTTGSCILGILSTIIAWVDQQLNKSVKKMNNQKPLVSNQWKLMVYTHWSHQPD